MIDTLNHILEALKNVLAYREIQMLVLGYIGGWAFKEYGAIALIVCILIAAGVFK